MALDDQLAALAAGELDDDTARTLRARAAADPAIAQQLARHEELHRLLRDWETPPMSEAASRRLDARVDEALAALDDGPLTERRATPAARPDAADDRAAAAGTGDGVVDLGRARRRRDAARPAGGGTIAWPSWGAAAAVAAALFAVVGVGIVLGGFPQGGGLDVLAGGGEDAEEEFAETAEDTAGPTDQEAATGMAEESAEADDEAAAPTTESFDSGGTATADAPTFGTARREDVAVEEGELLALLDPDRDAAAADGDSPEESDDGADEQRSLAAAEQCVDEALERDTAQADDREVTLLADGTYAGQSAVFVVVRTPQPGDDRYEVLAYEPGDCTLLARDETRR